MEHRLEIVNDSTDLKEMYDVGGDIGCFIACTGGCLITEMIAAPMAVATMALD